MVGRATHNKYDDREAGRAKQEAKDHFVIHLARFTCRRLEKPNRHSYEEKD